MKLYVKGIEIEPVTSWSFETITDALEQAYEKLKQNPNHETALKYADLYIIKKKMEEWIS